MKPSVCLTAAAIALTFAQSSFGIGAEEALRHTPDSPAAGESIRRAPKAADGTVSDETEVLIPALKGLVICRNAQEGLALQAGAAGVVSAGFSAAETAALERAAGEFIGAPVSLTSLDRLSEAVSGALEGGSRSMLRVAFPDQEITSGVVVLSVSPAVTGKVAVKGKQAFGRAFLDRSWNAKSGSELDRARVQADLDWLNENPLRRVTAAFSEGAGDDAFDVALEVDADKAWRAFAGVDNSLSDRLGDERWFAGFQHGDVFGLDHRLTLMATAGLDYDALHGASLSYEAPLPWRHLLEVTAGFSESSSVQGAGASLVDRDGTFRRMAVKYRVPLAPLHGWRQEWFGGFSLRDHDYDFGEEERGVSMFHVETGWRLRRQSGNAATDLTASLHWSPGGIGSGDAAYTALGADGADSLALRLLASHTLALSHGQALAFRADAQWSDSHLLASDQFAPAIGGRVRGFDEIAGYGDSGVSGSAEYLSPAWRPAGAGTFRGVLFVDGAVVHDRRAGDSDSLLSAGCGLRWQRGNLSASCDLGIPLSSPDGVEDDARLRFAVTARF